MEHSSFIGGSSAARAIGCPSSFVLARLTPIPPSNSSAADEGTMLHSATETIFAGADERSVIGYEELGHTLTDSLYDEMVAPALDMFDKLEDTYGQITFEQEIKVQLPEPLGEAWGTSDVIGYNDDYMFVVDWKFGRGVEVDAHKNKQGLFYALGACNTRPEFERKKIIIAIIQPAYGLSVYETDQAELDELYNDLCDAADVINAYDLSKFTTGKHCKFCKVEHVCPQKLAKSKKLPVLPTSEDGSYLNVGEHMDLADEVMSWAGALKKYAFDAAMAGVEQSGHKLVAKKANRSWVDEAAVLDVCKRSRKLKDVDYYNMKLKSPAQMEKVITAHEAPLLVMDPTDDGAKVKASQTALETQSKSSGYNLVVESAKGVAYVPATGMQKLGAAFGSLGK